GVTVNAPKLPLATKYNASGASPASNRVVPPGNENQRIRATIASSSRGSRSAKRGTRRTSASTSRGSRSSRSVGDDAVMRGRLDRGSDSTLPAHEENSITTQCRSEGSVVAFVLAECVSLAGRSRNSYSREAVAHVL